MTTIVRVKRHRTDDPVEALVLSCKRKKTEESDSDYDLLKKVFNFSGTVQEKDDEVAANTVESFNKESKYSNFKKTHTPEIRLKQRQEQKERSENNRFTLLSCLRSSNAAEHSDGETPPDSKENYTIVDVVSKDSNQKPVEHDASEGSYVYDLYSIQENDSDFNDFYMENLLSIQPLETELEYRNGEDCYEEVDPDEDDSNDENNWRNDYPDTDSRGDDFISETCNQESSDEESLLDYVSSTTLGMEEDESDDVLVKQLKGCHLGDDEYDLSGDSGEEEYLNYEDEDQYHYYEAEDLAGRRYAKYKANALKQMLHDNDIDNDSESEDDFLDCEVLSYFGDSD